MNISPDSVKILILWTVTPNLVEAFHAAFYSLCPHQSYWVASVARRLTRLVRHLASMAHRSTGNAQSKWVASLARIKVRLTGLVRCLAWLAHRMEPETPNQFVRYPGY